MNIKQLIMNIGWDAKIAYKRYKLKGIYNVILNRIDRLLLSPFALSKPLMLYISTCEGICNLSCKMCAPYSLKRKNELSFENFKKILDGFKYAIQLDLTGFSGEPFLVKDFFKMIDYAKSKNCRVILTTNMTLVDEEVAKKIVRSKLDCLGISLDAATPGLFEEIRCGAKFQTVINNIKTLNQIKKQLRSKIPKLLFFVTAMKKNIHELPDIIELASQLSIEQVSVHPLMPVPGTELAVEEQSLTNYPDLAENFFSAATEKAKRLNINLFHPNYRRHGIKFPNLCKQPWNAVYILADGTITPCCNYFPALGNVSKDGLGRLWNSKNFKSIRRVVRKEKSICYYCLKSLNQLELKLYSP